MKNYGKLAIVLLGALVVATVIRALGAPVPAVNESGRVQEQVKLLPQATSSLPVKVSGTVRAADRAVVAAQTGGVIDSFLVREGSYVYAGQELARQDTLVVDAQVVLRNAERSLMTVQQEAAIDAAEQLATQAEVIAYSAEELAHIQAFAADNRVQESARTTLVTTQAAVTTMLDALQFVNRNRSLFTSEGLRSYQTIVNELYGSMPRFFAGGVMYAVDTEDDLLAVVQALSEQEELSPVELQNIAMAVSAQMQALLRVYETAEADVLDRSVVDSTSSLYTQYFAQRAALLDVNADMLMQISALQIATDSSVQNSIQQNQSVAVTEIEHQSAARQAEFRTSIASASLQVANAAAGVVAAERSLGSVVAPFSGVVTKRLKQVGEYAQPGEPLLQLEGAGATELFVTVPEAFRAWLAVGDVFLRDGVPAGVVDRFSPVSTGKSISVVVALTAPDVLPGQALDGYIVFEGAEDAVYTLPRAYVHFGNDGAYVLNESGKVFDVQILYDAGSVLYVKSTETLLESLVPAHSISLD